MFHVKHIAASSLTFIITANTYLKFEVFLCNPVFRHKPELKVLLIIILYCFSFSQDKSEGL